MPKLPDFTALGEPPRPQPAQGIASFQPTDMSGLGRAITAAGGDIVEAANMVAATNDRQDQMMAEAAVNRLQEARLDLQAGQNGFMQVRGAAAVGPKFLQDYTEKFDAQRSDIAQSFLQNDNQRRYFERRVPVASIQYREALLRHQAGETDKFNDQTELSTVDAGRQQIIANPGNEAAIAGGRTQIEWALEQRAQRLGWSPVVLADTKAKYFEKINEDSAATQVEQGPAAALAAINKRMGVGQDAGPSGNQAIDGISVQELVKLRHRAVAYVVQGQNQQQAAAERRLKDAEQTYRALDDFAITGQMVSPAYEKQVMAMVTGTPYEEMARATIAGSYMGSFHGSKTLPQQQESLRQVDALQAQGGSSPDMLKFAQRMREITNTQAAAAKENPWAAATRFGKQPEVPEVQITNPMQVPQLVAQRLPLMNGVEVYSGAPASPLQPGEAKAWATQLASLPPDARAEVLGQTGAMLSGPRAMALAEQLDKQDKPLALALKMGLDRTTAGRAASALVLRGSQAIADKTVKKDEQALAGWRAEIAGLVRGTLGDDKAESDVIDAAYYVRAAQDQEGIAPAGFKSSGSGAADAIAMVIGQPIERAGVKTVLPRGMKEGDFDAKLKGYTPEKLREQAPAGVVFNRGTPVRLEQIANHLSEYGLKRDGAGRYIPVVRNAPLTLDPQGQQMLRLEVR